MEMGGRELTKKKREKTEEKTEEKREGRGKEEKNVMCCEQTEW